MSKLKVRKIKSLRKARLTYLAIAKRLKVHPNTVRHHLGKHGKTRSSKGFDVTSVFRRVARKMLVDAGALEAKAKLLREGAWALGRVR